MYPAKGGENVYHPSYVFRIEIINPVCVQLCLHPPRSAIRCGRNIAELPPSLSDSALRYHRRDNPHGSSRASHSSEWEKSLWPTCGMQNCHTSETPGTSNRLKHCVTSAEPQNTSESPPGPPSTSHSGKVVTKFAKAVDMCVVKRHFLCHGCKNWRGIRFQ